MEELLKGVNQKSLRFKVLVSVGVITSIIVLGLIISLIGNINDNEASSVSFPSVTPYVTNILTNKPEDSPSTISSPTISSPTIQVSPSERAFHDIKLTKTETGFGANSYLEYTGPSGEGSLALAYCGEQVLPEQFITSKDCRWSDLGGALELRNRLDEIQYFSMHSTDACNCGFSLNIYQVDLESGQISFVEWVEDSGMERLSEQELRAFYDKLELYQIKHERIFEEDLKTSYIWQASQSSLDCSQDGDYNKLPAQPDWICEELKTNAGLYGYSVEADRFDISVSLQPQNYSKKCDMGLGGASTYEFSNELIAGYDFCVVLDKVKGSLFGSNILNSNNSGNMIYMEVRKKNQNIQLTQEELAGIYLFLDSLNL